MVIDDLADRPHDCDVLLDQTYGRKPEDYKHLVPDNCKLLLGSEYALLRSEFSRLRPDSLASRENLSQPARILISLGSTDQHNIICKIIKAVERIKQPLEIDITTGINNPNIKEIESLSSKSSKTINLHTFISNIAEKMSQADIIIGASGCSSWERCVLGVPSIAVTIADNQLNIAEQLGKNGIQIDLGWYKDLTIQKITDELQELLSNNKKRTQMSKKASKICDGYGSLRLLLELHPPIITKTGKPVTIRKATSNDKKMFFDWQTPESRKYSKNPEVPDWKTHSVWFDNSLTSYTRNFMIIEFDKKPCGELKLDILSDSSYFPVSPNVDAREVSIMIVPEVQGNGVAMAALKLLREIFSKIDIWAEVLEGNNASKYLFQKAGYISRGSYFFSPAIKKDDGEKNE